MTMWEVDYDERLNSINGRLAQAGCGDKHGYTK